MRDCKTYTVCNSSCDECGRKVMAEGILDNLFLFSHRKHYDAKFNSMYGFYDIEQISFVKSKDLCEFCLEEKVKKIKEILE